MGWPGYFSGAMANVGRIYNYYSTGDKVFEEYGGVPGQLTGFLDNTVKHAWQKQEVLKGSGLLGGTAHGGWGFHWWLDYDHNAPIDDNSLELVRYSAIRAADMVASGVITNRPVFNRGYVPMLSANATLDQQWMTLAKYVPAVSSPIGGRSVATVLMTEFDMNDQMMIRRSNGWGRLPEHNQMPWLHSDMKDMAYYYVFDLYDDLLQRGGMR